VLLSDPEPLMYHAEIVYRDGVAVGDVRSASYGWTLGGAVGLAMVEGSEPVTASWLAAGSWEVDVAGTRYAATVSLRPMYDPTSARVTA
jgi:4-methylaminobutanoate oxidase (formaldehyde-forming)